MTMRIKRWLEQHNFIGNEWRWDYGNLRVAAIGDEFLILMFFGRAGDTPLAWSARFRCPDGKLSVPEHIVLATIKAAFKAADVAEVRS